MKTFLYSMAALPWVILLAGIIRALVYKHDDNKPNRLRQASNIYISISQFVATCTFRSYPSETVSDVLGEMSANYNSWTLNKIADVASWVEGKIEEAGY